MDGWSAWSFNATGNPNEVSMTVYLPANPNTWYNGTAYSPGGNSTINIPGESGCSDGNHSGTCTVRKATGQNTDCNHWTPEYNYCTNFDNRLSSCTGRCECDLGSVETGWCISSGYYCAGNPTVTRCPDPNAPIACRFFDGGTTESGGGDCDGWNSFYYYIYNTQFLTDKPNWKRNLSDAGGFARKVYIYSYPEKVYINYNGNGSNGTCTNWAAGSNTVNSNTGIAYSRGNPVCQSGQTVNGSMPSGENIAISWNGGKLAKNQYYRNGYDFKGWSTTPGGTKQYGDEAYFNGKTFTDMGYKPGSTLTLYAVWEKHEYKITYHIYCGTINSEPTKFKYNEGTSSLSTVDLSSCKTDEKSGTNGTNANPEFVGWFTNEGLTQSISSIPASRWSDIDLYGQVKESRYYNYSQGKWDWVN